MESTQYKDTDRNVKRINDNILMTFIDRGKGERYITYECSGNLIEDKNLSKNLSNNIAQSIMKLLNINGNSKESILVIGLGNRGMTADALGPRTIDLVKAGKKTKRTIYAFTPSVTGLTGLEAYDIVKGISDRVSPDYIIAVDTLASRRVNRISSAFQLTDAGIRPGSGVGNSRKVINGETMNIPVIAIGVPLVVYAKTLAQDVLSDYLDNAEKYELSEKAVEVIRKSLDYKPSDLVVTPKEIDIIVDTAAEIISNAINSALSDIN